MFGYTRQEAIGQPGTNWIHPEYRAMVRENMITDNEEPYEAVALRKDGTTFPCEIQGRVVYTEKGKVRITALRDITAKKIAEQKMKESNEQFKLLFEYSPLGIYIADTEGNIIDANQTLIAMLGSPSLESTKQINVLTFPPLVKNGYAGYFIDARDNNRIIFTEMDYTTKWGKQLSLSSYIVPLANEFGEVYSIFTIVDDITDRKNAENEILIAKNKAEESDLLKSAFLANMSHEIRTPMNAIIGFSKFLEDDNLDKDERVEFLGIINQKGADLLKLIDDILDLSKIEANQLILFYATSDVYSVVYEIVHSFNKTLKLKEYHYDKNIEVVIGLTNPEKIECYTDFNRVKQILSNLISNAMKFTEEGYIEVGYQLLLDKIEFYVKDTGIGIANENFDKIFQRFRQGDDFYQSRKYGGTGLGLSIVSGLVQALGGKIWVESEIGVGSIFHFTIDYVMTKDEVENNAEVIVTQEITHNTLVKILIVEDDYANYQLLKTTLNRVSNCSILFAQNGLESLEVYKRNNEIDLIFMDIGLPIMNGIEAYKKLREMGYTGKVVALTAYAMAEERENINSVGFDDYISKPYTTEEIKNLLRKYSFCKH
jgi:PAS domain S-box-containing protein